MSDWNGIKLITLIISLQCNAAATPSKTELHDTQQDLLMNWPQSIDLIARMCVMWWTDPITSDSQMQHTFPRMQLFKKCLHVLKRWCIYLLFTSYICTLFQWHSFKRQWQKKLRNVDDNKLLNAKHQKSESLFIPLSLTCNSGKTTSCGLILFAQ